MNAEKKVRARNLRPRDITDEQLVAREHKANTLTATAQAVKSFEALTGKSLPCDPEDLREYLLAAVNLGHSLATITTRMGLLTTWHDDYISKHGLTNQLNPARHSSVVTRVRAVRRTIGEPQKQAEALHYEQLEACILALESHHQQSTLLLDARKARSIQLSAIRDKAMFLVGFWFGLRSESLVSMKAKHIQIRKGKFGLQLFISLPETKTTNRFERTLDALDYLCPIPAVEDWLNASQARPDDPLFVSVNRWGDLMNTHIHVDSVIPMMRKVLDLAGLEARRFTTHSLRRGASIWADSKGASTKDRMDWFGWKDPVSALKYVDAQKSLPTALQQNVEPVRRALEILRTHLAEKSSTGTLEKSLSKDAIATLALIEADL